MKTAEFERYMRGYEVSAHANLPQDAYLAVRVYTPVFNKLQNDDAPLEYDIYKAMEAAARLLMQDMHGMYAFVGHGDISVLFSRDWDMFGRDMGRIISRAVSLVTYEFSRSSHIDPTIADTIPVFQAGIFFLPDVDTVTDYFRWRQADVRRVAMNVLASYVLTSAAKMSPQLASVVLQNQTYGFKKRLLDHYGHNPESYADYISLGSDLVWRRVSVMGTNPKASVPTTVTTSRNRIGSHAHLESGEGFSKHIRDYIEKYEKDHPPKGSSDSDDDEMVVMELVLDDSSVLTLEKFMEMLSRAESLGMEVVEGRGIRGNPGVSEI